VSFCQQIAQSSHPSKLAVQAAESMFCFNALLAQTQLGVYPSSFITHKPLIQPPGKRKRLEFPPGE
jgi:hypothetical protein